MGEDSEELSSLPKGGSTGQYLVKKSDEDGDADWQTLNLPELNYLPLSGGELSGSIHISHATNSTMDNTTTNPRISFSENGKQEVALVYTDYNDYRSPAGLKVVGIGSDAGPAWFEAEGNIYGAKVYGAVWNDYAEYRDQKEEIKPGYCVASANNG